MSRPVRIQFEGALYHITSRGDRREAIYEDDEDRSAFLKTLGEVTETFNWICHAYCLMTNHYHLVVETPDGNLSKGMRQLNGVYTQASNRRHQRTGHLFQGRYKAILVDADAYLLELTRYVVLNPVRAGMVSAPGLWSWSSYQGITVTVD
jgi:REP element-mobilizing transposase RayT